MFGIGKGIRFGFGYDIGHTLEGLARVDETLAELEPHAEVDEPTFDVVEGA